MGTREKFATSITVSVDAAAEVFTTAEAKEHLRFTSSSEDTLIDRLVKAARLFTQNEINRQIGEQTLIYRMVNFTASGIIELPRPPLTSLQKVRYKDQDGNWTTMYDATASPAVTSSVFDVETNVEPGALILAPNQAWPEPATGLYTGFPLEITYKCGYTTIPADLEAAMLLLIGHWFQHRESVVIGSLAQLNALVSGPVPQGYQSMIENHIWWGDEVEAV